ncbi:ATP-binding cassette sub-family D member 3 isoform X1 [Hydra vulgaris]|uniref:ATP-binding cassette sub-family D member 3 isoform X1 n=2 Tax=Hydra vulgaris TaxID=6087 RepID=UPI001F5E68F9|nr:ATP-binding cassette sub-family D member 3 isoform X1 [Hydra vulgaris]
MANSWSKVLSQTNSNLTPKNILLVASIFASTAAVVCGFRWSKKTPKWKNVYSKLQLSDENLKANKGAVDTNFVWQMIKIMKIIIPGPFSKEAARLVFIAFSLLSRTFCDVWMISMTTSIERSIISKDLISFKDNSINYITAMPLIAFVTQMMKFSIDELKISLRSRITFTLQDRYLDGMNFYKMNNLDGRVINPDQLLTEDLDKFCESFVGLYLKITKPLLDLIMYVKALINTSSYKNPLAIMGYLVISGYLILSGFLLTKLRKPVRQLTSDGQKLEGEFRHANSRIITHCEEIAFYQGQDREKFTLRESFNSLVANKHYMLTFRFLTRMADNIITKHLAKIVTICAMAISFFANNEQHKKMQSIEIMEEYYTTGKILLKMADALRRLSLVDRELSRLSGFAMNVASFIDVLNDMKNNCFVRSLVNAEQSKGTVDMSCKATFIEKDYIICFDRVPLVTPNGDVLIKELSFEVLSGRNVLVCGPNGCGKSTLFRILGGLWPAYGGSITKPDAKKLFYVPQRPYMTVGTLRDQIIYPDSVAQMEKKRISDNDLVSMLNLVHLGYILEREGGWASIQDWIDVLSGGEKQRIAMARLFYHAPQFAILDECTSAVSVDVEGYIYAHCREVGITLFTVSHRKSLWKYHEYVLYMDGKGGYKYNPIDENVTEFGS